MEFGGNSLPLFSSLEHIKTRFLFPLFTEVYCKRREWLYKKQGGV